MYGIPISWIIGLLLAIGAAVGGWTLVHTYNDAIRASQTLQSENASLRASKDNIQRLFDDADQLAKEAQAEAAQRAATNRALNQRLKELLANDPKAKGWADTTIPDSYVRLRRERDSSGKGSVPTANGTARADPGSAKGGPN